MQRCIVSAIFLTKVKTTQEVIIGVIKAMMERKRKMADLGGY